MNVKQYEMVEFSVGDAPSVAEFWQGEERVRAESFLKAEGEYAVRFMPHRVGEWRYRIGDYRLIAEIHDKELVIIAIDIGHRREVYR